MINYVTICQAYKFVHEMCGKSIPIDSFHNNYFDDPAGFFVWHIKKDCLKFAILLAFHTFAISQNIGKTQTNA